MPDVSSWYTKAGSLLAQGDSDFLTGDMRLALLDSTYILDKDNHDGYSDVSADEVTGTLYTAGGLVLPSRSITQDSASNETRLLAGSVQWGPGATIADIKYGVIYDNTPAAKPLWGYIIFEQAISITNGTFRVTFAATGALRLRAA